MVRLETPDSLAYPVRVTKLLKKAGDKVARNEAVCYYEYRSINQEYDEFTREHEDVERWWPSQLESEHEGTITSIHMAKGQTVTRKTLVAHIEEACRHEVQFGGLCADCGKDVNVITSYNETTSLASRATINTTHGRTDLFVSRTEASKADEEAKRRLLEARRLSLVVDLDQTVIHACVEPTIGEWQSDPTNPNHEAVKDVCKFQLADDAPGRPGTWYYIKLRPGLKEFLTTMSQYYEMHIYTMGTRAYAENIAKIIDPDRSVFGDRILSRDESGSMQAKNLKRLFPVDTKMVVIIDDRADVWSWISNLIKVKVFEFFVGIGDVNSSFLPKRPELEAKPESAKMDRMPSKKTDAESDTSDVTTNKEASTSSTAPITPLQTNGAVSAVEQMMSMAGNQDAGSIKSKEEEQEQTIAEQLDDRPLLQKQKILDAFEKEEGTGAEASPAAEAAVELLSSSGEKKEDTPPDTAAKKHYRHNLLQDDDTELKYLTQSLRNIHATYYEEYDREAAGSKGSRVAELRPGSTKKRSVDQFEHIPDAAAIMSDMKRKVLAGVHLVFSGVVPLGVDIQSHDMAVWARSFGAKVSENIGKKTTHIIASPERRTAKVRQAAKKGNRIAIVGQGWLFECFSQWKRLDENPYRIHSDAPTNGLTGLPESFEHEGKDYMLSSSDEEAAQTEDETDGTEMPNGTGSLALKTDLESDTDAEELERYAPKLAREDSSPILGENPDNWDSMEAELADFMDGDSDTESTNSHDSTDVESSAKKRRLEDRESEDEAEGSRLSKRKKEALGRTTSLTNMVKTVESTSRADIEENDTNEAKDADVGYVDDLDLEAALEAEMARDSGDEGTIAETNGTADE
ncbi:hypothetical protein DOTSEDRAFT_73343 [Dothistroma septosporum NZE10]|uniref:RNA polymerase II subunit A C-terminal domain phosphatase n=1 Tax=Dothistroma septosporum (strain NZE10 / CBS 128990) TaxID=675120 RepID=N1PM96_DOTSN|nr:hypothetical protein DOTSEDRAFT_73343 [Dothistroma septosporum NZE10]